MDHPAIYIVLLLGIVFIAPMLYMRLSTFTAVGKAAPDISSLVSDQRDESQAIYIYFMSDNCSMCRAMTPYIESLQQQYKNLYTVNINQDPKLARGFHVLGTPTLVAVENSKIKKMKLGKLSRHKIELFIKT